MRSTTSLAAIAFLASSVLAVPNILARTTDGLTPWVTVDDDGTAHTVTPYVTTVDGATSTVSAAPNDITGTVFTQTSYGKITTSTGSAPIATATAKDGAGSFAVCSNKDGTDAPWCSPNDGASLYPGTTYYFVWDSSYFTANTTVQIQGNYFNQTTGETTTQAFQSDKMVASWGFWALTVDSSLMLGKSSGQNISVQITALNTTTSTSSKSYKGPTVLVTNTPTYHAPAAKLPSGAALYIGLPVIFGFVALCLIGTCIWNKKQRRITLGNVMSRTRFGHGLGSKPRGGLTKRQKEQKAAERVVLMEREIEASGGQVYRDEPAHQEANHQRYSDVPRRDSDALGSLAGTPVEDRRMHFDRPGTGDGHTEAERNYFRDEMRRQDRDRL
ncbi:hypothetical protein KJ359_013114 [Pestalotiopsis sp. 9143b]|nr:hypothetical protein KJ359_013114 [Pestalotiopsis sp. 9143b]